MHSVKNELLKSGKEIFSTSPKAANNPSVPGKVMDQITHTGIKTVTEPIRFLGIAMEDGAEIVTKAAITGAKWTLGHTKNFLLNMPGVPMWVKRRSFRNSPFDVASNGALTSPPDLHGPDHPRSGPGA